MITNKVQDRFNSFKKTFAPILETSPFYTLDYSWPSIGFFDALTFPLRGMKQLDDFAELVIKGASAYLAIIAHDCWMKIGVDVVVDEQEEGILIGARNGADIPKGEEVVFHIERELKKILRDVPEVFAIFSDYNREMANYSNLFSPFAIGLVTGISPLVEGCWSRKTPKDFKENIEKVVKHLAPGCADYYAKLFPNENIGQIPELYLNNLIFPPILYSEDVPSRQAVAGILGFYKEYKLNNKNLLELAKNFLSLPDEVLSLAGIAIYSAFSEDTPSPEIISKIQTKGALVGTLREASNDVRKFCNLDIDWLYLEKFGAKEIKQIEKDLACGTIPWIRLSKEKILSAETFPELKSLLVAIATFNYKQALMQIDKILENSPDDIDLRIQRIFFDLITSDIKAAQEKAKALLSEPEAENNPALYNLIGMLDLIENNSKQALQSFSQARSFSVQDSTLASDISNNYAWALMSEGLHKDALDVLDLTLRQKPKHLVVLLNKLSCLIELKKFEQANIILKTLLQLSPLDHRVLHAVIYLRLFS